MHVISYRFIFLFWILEFFFLSFVGTFKKTTCTAFVGEHQLALKFLCYLYFRSTYECWNHITWYLKNIQQVHQITSMCSNLWHDCYLLTQHFLSLSEKQKRRSQFFWESVLGGSDISQWSCANCIACPSCVFAGESSGGQHWLECTTYTL